MALGMDADFLGVLRLVSTGNFVLFNRMWYSRPRLVCSLRPFANPRSSREQLLLDGNDTDGHDAYATVLGIVLVFPRFSFRFLALIAARGEQKAERDPAQQHP